jgi:hypothetical protein
VAVPFVPSLLLGVANVVSPNTLGGCVALFAALLVAFVSLIPLYVMVRPYRWLGLNMACAVNTVPVLGLLALTITDLRGRMGAVIDSAIATLLATQSALSLVTTALNIAVLLYSARMDPAKCLGEVLWTVERRSRWCPNSSPVAPLKFDPSMQCVLPSFVASQPKLCGPVLSSVRLHRLTLVRGIVAAFRVRAVRSAMEQHMALALLVETICIDKSGG